MARLTFSERVTAVAALGFTPRQAAFLTIVALHSGYCLRRQYADFTGQKYGKNVRDFLDGLVDRGLAGRLTLRADRGSIYHVYGRRLYTAIGQEDNRNRRHASPALIARKLMLLDFVLTMPSADWYATEADKVDLFLNRFGLPPSALPQRTYQPQASPAAQSPATRYCIQKLPFFVQGSPPSVHFVCLVTEPTAQAVEAFVREHASLLRLLEHWTLHVLVPPRTASQMTCAMAYDKALSSASLAAVEKDDLEWFTAARRRVLEGDLRQLSIADLRRYRELSKQLDRRLDRHRAGPAILHCLPHTYEQFGSQPGVV